MLFRQDNYEIAVDDVVEINVITTRFILHEGRWNNKMYHFKKKKHARYLLKILEKKVIKKLLQSE